MAKDIPKDIANDTMKLLLPLDAWSKLKSEKENLGKITFAWTIENFTERKELNGQSITSNNFIIRITDEIETEWRLIVYPKGIGNSNFLSVYINYQSNAEVRAKYDISILNANKKKRHHVEGIKHCFKSNLTFGHSDYLRHGILKNDTMQLLPNNSLTIYCDIKILEWRKIKDAEIKMESLCVKNMQDDFETGWMNAKFR